MRIYRHPDDETRIVAEEGTWRFDIARADLPADPAEALAFLWERYEETQVDIDPDTGEPIVPPLPPEPHPELDVDDEAVEVGDFEALAEKAAAEIAWLEETIPQIDAMTLEELRAVLKRVARENAETIRAWRYVIRRLA